MVSIQNLEFELEALLREKKYSEIIFEITTKTKEEERNAGLFVLLGISRISLNKKNKDQVQLAVDDFKKGYLKEINIGSEISYFDTNTTSHHHFYDEQTKELIDINSQEVEIKKSPIPPSGKKIEGIEVTFKISKN